MPFSFDVGRWTFGVRRFLLLWLPKQISRQTGQHDSQADQAIVRITIKRAEGNTATGDDEKQRCERMTRSTSWTGLHQRRIGLGSAPKHEDRRGRYGEEKYVKRSSGV